MIHKQIMPEAQRHLFDQIQRYNEISTNLNIKYWKQYELGQPQWWFLLACLVVPWIIWWVVVDKKRRKEILLYGLLLSLIATVLDCIGHAIGLWAYPHALLPLLPKLVPVDFSLLPA